MAEKHEIVELGSMNRDGKGAVSLAESSSGARRRRFVASVKALFGPSEKRGAVRPPESLERSAASSSSVSSSARIERTVQSRPEFASEVDWEIEALKDHWSELEPPRREESLSVAEDESEHLTNGEIVESLRKQYPRMSEFFHDGAGFVEVGEKIEEGAQADIFTAKLIGLDGYDFVLKVFKEGSLMRDLQKQWPLGLLNRCMERRMDENYLCSSPILIGTVVMNGRFAFVMWRRWGDLRKLLDKRMERTSNRCPPMTDIELWKNMYEIAMGMQSLHEDNIIHRDLKASNVLIVSSQGDDINGDNILPSYFCQVADYECSVGVVGTGFWRAPEILQGVKYRNITQMPIAPNLFTKKSDVYSFAMTCYEMVTGIIPFQGLALNNYDVVLQGKRPILPHGTKLWIKELLSRCWHHDPSERLDFMDIVQYIENHRYTCME